MLKLANDEDAIVLDFFAGSGTTAHSVLEMNRVDGGRRKFICVQLPEPVEKNSQAEKMGFKTISDLTQERIRRVIEKIKKNLEETQSKEVGKLFDTAEKVDLDLGFRSFKLQESNFKIWNASIEKSSEVIQSALDLHVQHISPLAQQESILFELLLKSGFELSTTITKMEIHGKTVFSIEDGELMICLEKQLTNELIKAIAETQPTRVILLDEGFQNNDQLKTNAVQIMKSKNVLNFRTV